MGAISEAMANDAVDHGASIFTSTPVQKIITQDGNATGILLGESIFRSSVQLARCRWRLTGDRGRKSRQIEGENFSFSLQKCLFIINSRNLTIHKK